MLSDKIKKARITKGLSQEALAELTGLNIRTIQRIENGETEPRGDSLIRICNTLDLSPDELMEWGQNEDRPFLMTMNLSALTFIFFPLFGILIPLILWLNKKDKIKKADQMGKMILNFQITWNIVLFTGFIFHNISVIRNFKYHADISPSLLNITELFYFLAFMIIWNLTFIIYNSFRSYKGNKTFYFPYIPFFR